MPCPRPRGKLFSAQLTTPSCLSYARSHLPLMPARETLLPATSYPLPTLFQAFVTLPFPGSSLTPTLPLSSCPFALLSIPFAAQKLLWLEVAVGRV